ncbi:hypothetical protein [Dyella lutea]|uniref:Glycosyltransferase involved in cell wall biosynthesis n=1 Tax=Dyella lutea TaxID=2950441 RepID=A0ABT1F7S2_9GAMM|nr:hypothetical protein [Dyella lutea]MCP1373425.1 hypothetical protein [Dyella lutea]
MNLFEKIAWYYRHRGLGALIARVINGRPLTADQILGGDVGATNQGGAPAKSGQGFASAHAVLSRRFLAIQPMRVYSVPGTEERLNLVTDSINMGSLFGGVGTAILLAAMLATRRGAKLRVVTRTEAPDERGFAQVLECNGLMVPGNVEFVHLNVADSKAQLDVCDGDRFLTTSWWTTASVLGSVAARKVDYLLQEDERMFYPYGDDWIRCNEIMLRSDIRFVINTELLYRHLLETGMTHLRDTAVWFEPAFPAPPVRQRQGRLDQAKRKLFFYARPNNVRNLFYRGLEVLDRAVSEGVLAPELWEVVLVGKDVPKVRLGDSVEPTVLPTMGWREYRDFIAGVDAGFCLMSTPHPSYPPLDLASAGSFVLTNKFGIKQDLGNYSPRIVCADLSTAALLDGLRTVIAMAEGAAVGPGDDDWKGARCWKTSLGGVIEFLR